jgi:hypothetical protein
MLPPVANDLQPFRFVSLATEDQQRLDALVAQRSDSTKPAPKPAQDLVPPNPVQILASNPAQAIAPKPVVNPMPNEEWIEKLRSASAQASKTRSWRFKVLGEIGLLLVGLATAAYVLHFGLLK